MDKGIGVTLVDTGGRDGSKPLFLVVGFNVGFQPSTPDPDPHILVQTREMTDVRTNVNGR